MRRLFIILIALVVMFPTMTLAAEWYRCRADGQTRSACCCPGEAAKANDVPADAPPDVRSSCCCDIEAASVQTSHSRMTSDAGAALAAIVVPRAVADVQSPPIAIALRPAAVVAHPSSRSPPLFLSHCSFLL